VTRAAATNPSVALCLVPWGTTGEESGGRLNHPSASTTREAPQVPGTKVRESRWGGGGWGGEIKQQREREIREIVGNIESDARFKFT
jgi:hypothetical protein